VGDDTGTPAVRSRGIPDEVGDGHHTIVADRPGSVAYGVGRRLWHEDSNSLHLPAGTGDADWLRAFDAVIPPLLGQFRP
jgi:acetoin utilization deacetylase AcuC-like enzyme